MTSILISEETEAKLKRNQRPSENLHEVANRLLVEKVAVEHRCPGEFVWLGRLTMTERVDAIELKSGDVEVSIPFLGEIH